MFEFCAFGAGKVRDPELTARLIAVIKSTAPNIEPVTVKANAVGLNAPGEGVGV